MAWRARKEGLLQQLRVTVAAASVRAYIAELALGHALFAAASLDCHRGPRDALLPRSVAWGIAHAARCMTEVRS